MRLQVFLRKRGARLPEGRMPSRMKFRLLKMSRATAIFGLLLLVVFGFVGAPTRAQEQSQQQAANPNPPKPSQSQPAQELPASPPVKPADVASMDAILAA